MIRVLICDDQMIVCEGLRAILSTARNIKVVGVAHDGARAVEMIPETQPDIVLMDLKMPIMNGIQATRLICDQYPQARVSHAHHWRYRSPTFSPFGGDLQSLLIGLGGLVESALRHLYFSQVPDGI